MRNLRLIIGAAAAALAGAAFAQTTLPVQTLGSVTHLPVPRFVSLRSDEVNFRAGPGFQYPVTWVYHREGLPVEITAEFDVWRQILAPDGGIGWVHEATIRAKRGFYVTAAKAPLLASPDANAAIAGYVTSGVSGPLLACDSGADYCKVEAGHVSGYLARADFWGAFPQEALK